MSFIDSNLAVDTPGPSVNPQPPDPGRRCGSQACQCHALLLRRIVAGGSWADAHVSRHRTWAGAAHCRALRHGRIAHTILRACTTRGHFANPIPVPPLRRQPVQSCDCQPVLKHLLDTYLTSLTYLTLSTCRRHSTTPGARPSGPPPTTSCALACTTSTMSCRRSGRY